MKEFVEKLIGRLDKYTFSINTEELYYDKVVGMYELLKIINQLAEEYKDKVIIDGQYCWQTCGANEHCKECNRLSNGSIDYYENYDCLAEEYNNDFCEWKLDGVYLLCQHNTELVISCLEEEKYRYTYCPICGKKIKVVE